MSKFKPKQNTGDHFYIFPVVGDEKKLPFYVLGMGANAKEHYCKKDDGINIPLLLYSTQGEGIVTINGETTKVSNCVTVFIPANTPYEYYPINGSNWNTRWINFKGFAVDETLAALGLDKPIIMQLSNTTKLDKLFSEIYYSLNKGNLYGNSYSSGYLYNFLLEYSRCIKHNGANDFPEKSMIMTNILDYIDEHFTSDITLESLCHVAKISPQHLCRIFKKSINMRPMEYIAKKRISEAKKLLARTSKSITEISDEVGFNNCNYFCIVFKKYESISPTEYRRTVGT